MASSGSEPPPSSPPPPPSHLDGDTVYTRVDMGGSGEPSDPPILIQRFAEGTPVYGVQPIGKEIYVIRDSTPYIEVYDRRTFQHVSNRSIENRGPYDMVQSDPDPSSAPLFIADWFNAVNLTIVKVPNGPVTQWSFLEPEQTTLGLARSNRYTGANILVTAAVSQKIKEFTPDGSRVSEIIVSDITRPRQSIKVAPDSYAVCHGYGDDEEHQVCLVDGNGVTIRSYGGVRGSGVGQLDTPARLELTKDNCILVADSRNRRVVLLDGNLHFVRNLIDRDLDGPCRLFLDEAQGLLYVADNTVDPTGRAVSGCVKVFRIYRN